MCLSTSLLSVSIDTLMIVQKAEGTYNLQSTLYKIQEEISQAIKKDAAFKSLKCQFKCNNCCGIITIAK